LAQVGEATQVGLELTRTLSGQTDIATGSSAVDALYRTWSAKGSLTSETPIGVVSGQVYHNAAQTTTDGNVNIGPVTETNARAHFDNGVTVAQLSDLYQINSAHTLREAVEYRHNELSSELTDNGTVSYDVYADSLMWDWQMSPTLSWTNAGRIDHLSLSRSGPMLAGFDRTNGYYDHSLDAYSYNSGLVDKLTENDTVRLAVGQAVQAPSLLEYGLLQQLTLGPKTGILAGDVSTKPTLVKKYELGYAHSLPEYGVTLNNSLYYQKTEDMKGLGTSILQSQQTTVALSGNVGNSEERGLETGIAYKTGNGLKLDANYTFADITEHPNAGDATPDAKGTPTHKINLHAGYTIDRVELDGYGHYVSHIYQQTINSGGSQTTAVPGYFELDVRVGYHVTETVTAALSGSSINIAHHQEDTGAAVDRQVMGTISVKF
jgi:iron complex outermembrane receptor protein